MIRICNLLVLSSILGPIAAAAAAATTKTQTRQFLKISIVLFISLEFNNRINVLSVADQTESR